MEPRFPMWRPIVTAPKDGTRILCGWMATEEVEFLRWVESREAWCAGLGGWGEDRYRGDEMPTHWMPRPKPPK